MRVSRRDLVLIIAAWAAVRLMLIPLIGIHAPGQRNGDVVDFVALARAFADHASFIGAPALFQRDPGYPLFLAATLWAGWPAVYALQSLLMLGAALLTERRLGLVPALLIAGCPFFPIFEWVLMSEIPTVAALWCGWLLAFQPRRRWDLVTAGVLLGTAVATRLVLLPAVLAAMLVLAVGRAGWRAFAQVAAAALPVALASAIPHDARGRIGFQLWIGTWERDPEWKKDSIAGPFPPEAFTSAADRARLTAALPSHDDGAFLAATAHRLRTDPGFVARSWLARYRYLWLGTRSETATTAFARFSPAWIAFKAALWLLNALLLMLGLAGGVLALARRDRAAAMLAPVAAIALTYLPFHSTELRYSLAAVPFLLALGAWLVSTIQWRRLRRISGTPQREQQLRHPPGALASGTALTTER